MDNLVAALIAIIPPILTGILFYLVYRAITRADRNERRALAEYEREQLTADDSRAQAGAAPSDITPDKS